MEIGNEVYLTKDIEGIRAGIRAIVDGKFTSIIDNSITYTIYIKAFDTELKVNPEDIALYTSPHTGNLFKEGKPTSDFI